MELRYSEMKKQKNKHLKKKSYLRCKAEWDPQSFNRDFRTTISLFPSSKSFSFVFEWVCSLLRSKFSLVLTHPPDATYNKKFKKKVHSCKVLFKKKKSRKKLLWNGWVQHFTPLQVWFQSVHLHPDQRNASWESWAASRVSSEAAGVMGWEASMTRDLVKRKLKEGTESIKHCTATAEWHDVSNVEW